MARGKIRIQRIENLKNRQIILSNRRAGLFKKARELTILCDAQISMLLVNGRGFISEYISPSLRTKDVIDRYQRTLGIDLWSEHYEIMEEELKKLKETNMSLRRQIGRRTSGEYLNDLSFEELITLESEVEGSLQTLRERKYHKIRTHIEACKQKLKRLEIMGELILTGHGGAMDDPSYGVVDNGGVYDYGFRHVVASIKQPNQPIWDGQTESCLTTDSSISQQNFHGETESVRTPCSSLNLPDATSEDFQI